SSQRKRKHRNAPRGYDGSNDSSYHVDYVSRPIDPVLFVVAHEADIIRGPQATAAAASLEFHDNKPGSGLLRWTGYRIATAYRAEDVVQEAEDEKEKEVWVDRYDARLLLDALPLPSTSRASSPTGWSDLPSDTEDTFFLSNDEAEEHRIEKRRRLMDQNREERIRAREAEDGDVVKIQQDVWGGSDEEPDEPQREIMRRTAEKLVSSPDAVQLEMRILANHGADPRFAFLRGRWSRSWALVKANQREKDKQAKDKQAMGLGLLADYPDSEEETASPEEPSPPEPPYPDAEKKAARLAKAKEWAEKRRGAKQETS
ncbi:hypothetical protein C8J56DRAFT_425492, partial [Mycena floridula]